MLRSRCRLRSTTLALQSTVAASMFSILTQRDCRRGVRLEQHAPAQDTCHDTAKVASLETRRHLGHLDRVLAPHVDTAEQDDERFQGYNLSRFIALRVLGADMGASIRSTLRELTARQKSVCDFLCRDNHAGVVWEIGDKGSVHELL